MYPPAEEEHWLPIDGSFRFRRYDNTHPSVRERFTEEDYYTLIDKARNYLYMNEPFDPLGLLDFHLYRFNEFANDRNWIWKQADAYAPIIKFIAAFPIEWFNHLRQKSTPFVDFDMMEEMNVRWNQLIIFIQRYTQMRDLVYQDQNYDDQPNIQWDNVNQNNGFNMQFQNR